MPSPSWRCSICGETIRHYEYAPRVRTTYRCSTCRLDLRWNEETATLCVAPFQAPEDNRRSGNDRRVFARGGRRAADSTETDGNSGS